MFTQILVFSDKRNVRREVADDITKDVPADTLRQKTNKGQGIATVIRQQNRCKNKSSVNVRANIKGRILLSNFSDMFAVLKYLVNSFIDTLLLFFSATIEDL